MLFPAVYNTIKSGWGGGLRGGGWGGAAGELATDAHEMESSLAAIKGLGFRASDSEV